MRVAIAEDSVLLREGVTRLLGEAGHEVVAQCEDADELLRNVRAAPPDVAIVDNGIGGASTEDGSGLRGLADRVEALGGRLRVWTPRGGGTRVRAEIPCA